MNAADNEAAAALATVAVAVVAVEVVEGTQVEVTLVTAMGARRRITHMVGMSTPKNPFRNIGKDNNNNKSANVAANNVNGGGAAKDKEVVECYI